MDKFVMYYFVSICIHFKETIDDYKKKPVNIFQRIHIKREMCINI